jgi:hypothetical protein
MTSGRLVVGSLASASMAPARLYESRVKVLAQATQPAGTLAAPRMGGVVSRVCGTVQSFRYWLKDCTDFGSGRQAWARAGPMATGRCGAARRP